MPVASRPRTTRRGSSPFATVGQSIAVAASGGLALVLAAPVAFAAPGPTAPQVDTVQASAGADVSPTVVVPADAVWSIETTVVSGEKPAPEPEPVVREATAASRSTERTAIAPTTASAPAAPASATAAAVLEIARRYVGVPYVWGGTTPAGFDCSGYTQYVYAQVGVALPRTSAAQAGVGTIVSAADARPGDLVSWPGHSGIYTGNGQHIAARQPGTALYEGPVYGANPTYIRVL